MTVGEMLAALIAALEALDAEEPLAEGGAALQIARDRVQLLEHQRTAHEGQGRQEEARPASLTPLIYILLTDPRAQRSQAVQNDLWGACKAVEDRRRTLRALWHQERNAPGAFGCDDEAEV